MTYLIYLSFVDIKKRELEYWQTGLAYIPALSVVISLIFVKKEFMALSLIHVIGALITFGLMLLFTVIGSKGNSFAFGGADIWICGALGLCFGVFEIWGVLIVSFVSYLLYALFYKVAKKKKATHTAFVPFLLIGAIYGVCKMLFL